MMREVINGPIQREIERERERGGARIFTGGVCVPNQDQATTPPKI